jgi:nitrite reductase (NADH) small subunit
MSGKTKWLRVVACESIPVREGRSMFVLFNLGDRFLATENRCPHQGGPLSDGIVTGNLVVCPLHSWKINLETGQVPNPASPVPCVKTYATRIEDGIVYLEISLSDGGDEAVPAPCAHRDRQREDCRRGQRGNYGRTRCPDRPDLAAWGRYRAPGAIM